MSELKLIAKFRRIKNYEDISRDKYLDALIKSKPFKDAKELRKKNRDEDKIIRNLRAFYNQKKIIINRKK